MQFESSEDIFDVLNDLHRLMRDEEEERIEKESSRDTGDEGATAGVHRTTRRKKRMLSEKRVLVASRTSLQALAVRLNRKKEQKYFSSLRSNFQKPLLHQTDTMYDGSSGGRRDFDASSPRSQLRLPDEEREDTIDRDIFSYFHLVDTFLDVRKNETESIRDQVNEVFLNEPKSHPWILWNIGSATSSRLASRLGSEFSVVASFLLIMMPGSISFFYGDEIGLKDSVDPLSNRVSILRSGKLLYPQLFTACIPDSHMCV